MRRRVCAFLCSRSPVISTTTSYVDDRANTKNRVYPMNGFIRSEGLLMRAIQVPRFGGPEVLVGTDLPKPVAELGQVVVDVWVVPVLFLDTQIRSGSARDWFPTQPPYV